MTSAACWREASETLEVLDLRCQFKLTDVGFKRLTAAFPNLRSIEFDFSSQFVTDATIIFELPRLASLRELNLSHCNVTIAGMRHLPEKLESLTLGGNLLSDEMLTTVARRCTRLRSLNLGGGNAVTDAAIVEIATILALRKVNLSHSNVTDLALAHVVERCDLEFLDISFCENVTDVSIFAIAAHCPSLKELAMHATPGENRVTEASIPALARCVSLTSLNLSSRNTLTDCSIVPLVAHLSRLVVLNLHDCSIGDLTGLAIGRSCPMLEDLNVQDSCHFDGGPRGRQAGYAKERSISDDFMVAVASGCRRLRMLKLSSDMISDLSLVALARWSIDLRLLMLKGRSKVTDVGCMALALGCLLLRHISLMTEHVTSQGIAAFSGLNSIWLHRTDHVDLSGLKALMRRSPNLTSVIAENLRESPRTAVLFDAR